MSSEEISRLDQIASMLLPYIAILAILPDKDAGPEAIIDHGTVSFIHTGTAPLLLTCAHVHKALQRQLNDYPKAVLAVLPTKGDAIFLADEELVDIEGTHLDLAVFRLKSPSQIYDIGKQYYTSQSWPPAPPTVGSDVITIGYPGTKEMKPENGGLRAPAAILVDTVTSVSDRHFVQVDENSERRLVLLSENLSTPDDFGGMSGSAVYEYVPHGRYYRFCGIHYEGTQYMAPKVENSMFYHINVGYITGEGKIDRGLMPWT